MKSYKNRQLKGEELISKSFEKINQNSSEAEADLIELYQQDENLLQQIQGITATGSTNTLVDVFSVTTTGSANEYKATYSDFEPFAGLKVLVNFHEPNTGAATLNWNGNGAKPIKTLGREVKENEITGLALLQYSGTVWEMLDNNGIREENRRLEATVSPKIEQLELKDVSLEQKDESLEAQIEQLRSDIQSLTQQLNNKVDKTIGLEHISDALAIERSGLYWCAGTQNTPEAHGMLIVGIPWNSDLNYRALTFISVQTGKIYTRHRWQGNWSDNWIEKK